MLFLFLQQMLLQIIVATIVLFEICNIVLRVYKSVGNFWNWLVEKSERNNTIVSVDLFIALALIVNIFQMAETVSLCYLQILSTLTKETISIVVEMRLAKPSLRQSRPFYSWEVIGSRRIAA